MKIERFNQSLKYREIMAKIMQNLVVLIEQANIPWVTSFKAAKMCFNRFCIDEDAAFEFSGVRDRVNVPFKAKGYPMSTTTAFNKC